MNLNMNPTRPFPFLWDCEVKNRKRRAMLSSNKLEINFEVKLQYVDQYSEQLLKAALGLNAIRLIEADALNTRWVAIQDADTFYKRLPAWEAMMLLYGEDAIAIGWEDAHTGELDGLLFAQARYAHDWGCFNPNLFARFEESNHA